MTWRSSIFLPLLVAGVAGAAGPEVVWKDDDAYPIPEPAEDEEAELIWWDGLHNMTLYQVGKVLDLGDSLRTVGEWMGVVGPREAANVNALDEVPDSTWFTNRHGRERLSSVALARGSATGPPPVPDGPLVVRSGKALGISPGFFVEDRAGNEYLVKFDPPKIPEMATGAEIVSSRVLHALGWNVPDYHLFVLDPDRLEIGEEAWTEDSYNRKRPLTKKDVETILSRAARQSDGRIRAIASRVIPGVPKGPFRTTGVRPDDPNDTVPHEDRRDLRALWIVASWIHYTDARQGNFYDTFVREPGDPPGRGHLVHYLLDFSSSLGSGNTQWKDFRDGKEYFFDPAVIGRSLFSLGLWVKPWEDPPEVEHPELGMFEAKVFDPERWRTRYPNPLFDHATVRDAFWGAKLVNSFTDDDIRAVASAGEWSDPKAEEELIRILAARRDVIARTWFRTDRINPTDRFVVGEGGLRFTDLAVESGVADGAQARYRYRSPGSGWALTRDPAVPLAAGTVELETSHDEGRTWSPTTQVFVEGRRILRVERQTR